MIFIAQREGFVPAQQVSTSLDVPASFLAKVLQRLTASGLLESQRGPAGGVRLARPATEIRFADILQVMDRSQPQSGCLFGWPDCSRDTPCTLHAMWGALLDPLDERLRTATLSEVAGLLHGELSGGQRPSALKKDKRLTNPYTATCQDC